MLRGAEIAAAAALSILAHAALFLGAPTPDGGDSASGAGAMIVADAEIAALVEEWTKPVEATPPPKPPAPLLLDAALPEPPPPEPEKQEPKKEKKPEPKRKSAAPAGAQGAAGASQRKSVASGRGRAEQSGAGRAAASLQRQWGARIRAAIARKRVYPREARRRGVQGRAVLRMSVSRSGTLLAVSIARSSGSRALDQAALTAVRRASPYPAAPSGLPGARHRFTIPLTFKVK